MSTMRAYAPSLAKRDGGRGGERGGHGKHGVCANEREYDDDLVEGLGDSQRQKRLKRQKATHRSMPCRVPRGWLTRRWCEQRNLDIITWQSVGRRCLRAGGDGVVEDERGARLERDGDGRRQRFLLKRCAGNHLCG